MTIHITCTAIGLVLDLLGAIVVGFVVPKFEAIYADGAGPRVEGAGLLWNRWAWIAIILGFALQLFDAVRV